MKIPTIIIALAAMVLASPSRGVLDAQEAGCRPTDEHVQGLREYALQLATEQSADMDSLRTRYGIVRVDASQVEIVSDARTCASAARKFKHELGEHGKSDRQVYVVRVGERYIVSDPTAKAGEFEVHMVFDKHFKLLATFAG